jgi:hypothetical protein
MSQPSNISTVDISVNKKTPAGKYFNNYFISPGNIGSNQNDAVTAFFETITNGNKESAAVLASTVTYTAMAQGVDPMSIVQQFQNLDKGEINLYLAMFLNLNRVGTSLVGLNNQPVQNKYVTRTILA